MSTGDTLRGRNWDALQSFRPQVIGRIEHRIAQPRVDGGFAPSDAPGTDPDVLGERAVLDLPVHGRATEAGKFEDGLDPEDGVGGIGLHRNIPGWTEAL